MEIIFKIKDKSGREIYLSKERWKHIKKRHPNLLNPDYIEETLNEPIKIMVNEENIMIYYRYFKQRKEQSKYLKVVVKYLNAKGYVITSYFVKHII